MLSEHLKATKERYLADVRNGKGGDWTVVMGNEAGGASPTAFIWSNNN
jgi:exopolyphosphatase